MVWFGEEERKPEGGEGIQLKLMAETIDFFRTSQWGRGVQCVQLAGQSVETAGLGRSVELACRRQGPGHGSDSWQMEPKLKKNRCRHRHFERSACLSAPPTLHDLFQ